jgi:hypothetical protein
LLRFWVRPGNNNPDEMKRLDSGLRRNDAQGFHTFHPSPPFSSITKAPEKCYAIKVNETAGKNISERVLAIEVKVA